MLNTIKSGDRNVLRDFEASLLEIVDEVVGLMVRSTDPGGDTLAGALGRFGESFGNVGIRAWKNTDKIPLGDLEFQPGHLFEEGAVAAKGPTGIDGVVLGVKSNSFMTLLDEVIDHLNGISTVIDVDTVDIELLGLVDE